MKSYSKILKLMTTFLFSFTSNYFCFTFQEMSSYFGIGLAVSFGKVLIPRLKTPVSAISSIKSRHFKLALFLGSYVGIYKVRKM